MTNKPERTPNTPGVIRMPTGIQGFDEIAYGGLPRNRTSLVIGGAGCGKTVFALQVLAHGARHCGEPGIFVGFEETWREIIANAASFGWDLQTLAQEGKLFFLDAHLSTDVVISGTFDLAGMLASLQAKVDEMRATRIVFDSVDVLLSLLNHPVSRRRETYRVRDWLATSGLTGIVTARIEPEGGPLTERYGFMQFMADCVVLLQRRLIDGVSLRELQVVKYRGSHFKQNAFPMSIGSQGIEVASFGSEDSEAEVCAERVSSGIQRLDAMLGGGYYRGASVLITGAPGTAKSTLAAVFTEAACRRGETTLYLSFDECSGVMVRDMCSVNVRLSPYIASGLLKMYSAYGMARSTGEHLIRLQALIREHQPRCMVIDPVSAMLKVGPPVGVAQELLHAAQRNGITIVFISLTEAGDTDADTSAAPLLTLADTTIHLSYVAQAGERNRALTIVKSRGTKHSNQVRELILSDQGVTLADVYTVGGEVLIGTLRKEKERVAQLEKEGKRAEADRKRRELEATAADTQVRMVALHRELEARQAEIAALLSAQQAQEELWDAEREDIGQMRGKDQQ